MLDLDPAMVFVDAGLFLPGVHIRSYSDLTDILLLNKADRTRETTEVLDICDENSEVRCQYNVQRIQK